MSNWFTCASDFLFTFHRDSRNVTFLAPAFLVNSLQSVIDEILMKKNFTFACVHAGICSREVSKHIQVGGRQLIMYISDKLANQCCMTSKYLIASQRNYNQSKLLRTGKKILFKKISLHSKHFLSSCDLFMGFLETQELDFLDKWLIVNYSMSANLPPTLMNSNIVNLNTQYNESKFSPLMQCEWHNCFILLFTKCQSFISALHHSIELRCAVNVIPVMSSC